MKIVMYIIMYMYFYINYIYIIICDLECDVWGSSIRKSYCVDQAVYYLQRRCEQMLQITQYRNTRGYSHLPQKWSSSDFQDM